MPSLWCRGRTRLSLKRRGLLLRTSFYLHRTRLVSADNRPCVNRLRLLIAGESHYDEGAPPPSAQISSFTSEIVSRWGANAEGYKRFFGNIYATFDDDGAHWSSDAFKRFWNSVYFYNYVQSFVHGGPGERPTAKQFSDSADAFYVVLDDNPRRSS